MAIQHFKFQLLGCRHYQGKNAEILMAIQHFLSLNCLAAVIFQAKMPKVMLSNILSFTSSCLAAVIIKAKGLKLKATRHFP